MIEQSPLTDLQLRTLLSPLNPKRVMSRKGGGGSSLSYLAAWDVKATLIRVFGYGNFSAEVIESKIERILTKAEAGGNANWVVLATATVKLTIHQTGAVYSETAASSQSGSQIGEVSDFAIKTAESDALKRAAIYLGTQFGLSLYDNGSTSDVIRTVVTPGQLTINGQRQEESAPAQQHGDAVTAAPAPTADDPKPEESAEAVADATGTEASDERHQAEGKALLEKALNAKAVKEDEPAQQ